MSTPNNPVVTNALSDVRVKYHINPREIGHGHYGVVRKCMHRDTREWYAIKSIRKAKVSKLDVLRREVSILREVNHPNIIRLVDIYEDSKYLHIITELCTGGELFDRIIAKTQSDEGHFSEVDAAQIIRCILDAISYCHDVKQIVHRDLKPENFLFRTEDENSDIKIIDFGLSRHDSNPTHIMKTKVGTPYYVAPEVLNREYTKACDIWSIGVITYILLCGYPPFYGDSDNQIFDSVRTAKFDFPSPEWDEISDTAKDFIVCLLRKDPSERLTAKLSMKHRWIVENTTPKQLGPSLSRTKLVHRKSNRTKSFKQFRGMQKLKKAVMGYIAMHLSKAELGTLGDTFQLIDKNGDGTLTLEELDEALAHGNFSSDVRSELKRLREDLTLSEEEVLNWKDFIANMMDKNVMMKEEKMREAFEHFKGDRPATTRSASKSKFLLYEDLVTVLGSEAQASEVVGGRCDDVKITYDQFRQMMADSFAEQGNDD